MFDPARGDAMHAAHRNRQIVIEGGGGIARGTGIIDEIPARSELQGRIPCSGYGGIVADVDSERKSLGSRPLDFQFRGATRLGADIPDGHG